MFGLINLLLDFILLSMKNIMQYSEDSKTAFNITFTYYISKIINIFIIRIFTTDIKYFCSIHLILSATVIFVTILKNKDIFRSFKFKTSIINYLKYSLIDIPSCLGMLIIYGLGISKVTTNSTMFLASYNAVAMCTDTQWDILSSSINTNTSINILNNRYEKDKRSIFKNSMIYATLLFISSLILIFVMYLTSDNLNMKVMLTMLFLECSLFPVYGLRYTMVSWIGIENPCKEIVIIGTSNYVFRTIISMLIPSNYALNLGVLFSALYANTFYILLYVKIRKQRSKNKELLKVE